MLRRRERMGSAAREALGARVFERVTALEVFEDATTVLAYAGFGSEPRTDGFLRTVLARRKTLVLPRVEGRYLGLYSVTRLRHQLETGSLGIPEPKPELCGRVEPWEVDFVLVPGVAFDVGGGRLGYGRGYYDRLLPRVGRRSARVGGAFEVQVVASVPTDEHDERVHLVVTEERTYGAEPPR